MAENREKNISVISYRRESIDAQKAATSLSNESSVPDVKSDDDFDSFLDEQDILNDAFKAMMDREKGGQEKHNDLEADTTASVTASINYVVAKGSECIQLSDCYSASFSGATTSFSQADASNVSDNLLKTAAGPQSPGNKLASISLIPRSDRSSPDKPSLPISGQHNYEGNTSVLGLHQVNEVCGNICEKKTKGVDGEVEPGARDTSFVVAERDNCHSQAAATTPSQDSSASPNTGTRRTRENALQLCSLPDKESYAIGSVRKSPDSVCLINRNSHEQSPENAVSHIINRKDFIADGTQRCGELTCVENPSTETESDKLEVHSDSIQPHNSKETIAVEPRPDLWICETDSNFFIVDSNNKGEEAHCSQGDLSAINVAGTGTGLCETTFALTYEESARRTGLTTFASIAGSRDNSKESMLLGDHVSMIKQTEDLSESDIVRRSIKDGHSSLTVVTAECKPKPPESVSADQDDLNANELACSAGSELQSQHVAALSGGASSPHIDTNLPDKATRADSNHTVKSNSQTELSNTHVSLTGNGSEECASSASLKGNKMRCEPILRHYMVDEESNGETIHTTESICQTRNLAGDADLGESGIRLSPVSAILTTNTANLEVNHCPVNGNADSLDTIKSELEACGDTSGKGIAGSCGTSRTAVDVCPSPAEKPTCSGQSLNHMVLDKPVAAEPEFKSDSQQSGQNYKEVLQSKINQMVSVEAIDKASGNKSKQAAADVAQANPRNDILLNTAEDNSKQSPDQHSRQSSPQVEAGNNEACISNASMLPTHTNVTWSASKSISSLPKALGSSNSKENITKEYYCSTRSIYSHLLRRQPQTCSQRPKSMHSVQVSSCLSEDNTFSATSIPAKTLLPRSHTCQEEFSRCSSIRSSKEKIANRRSLVLESLKLCDFRGCPCRTFKLIGKSTAPDNGKASPQGTTDCSISTLRNEPLRTCTCTCQRHPAIQTSIVTPKHSGNKNSCLQTNPDNTYPGSCKSKEEILTSDDNFRNQDSNQNQEEKDDNGSHDSKPSGQLVMTEAMKYTRDKLLHRCKEDLVVLREHFKKQSQAVSEELVQLLQDRHELQEQVEMRRIAIEQLLRFQTESSDVKELNSVQMSVILPEPEQR